MATENYGQDGTVHLTYFDVETQLSFVWDGEHGNTIAVSHGGYGEPVIDVIGTSFEIYDALSVILVFFRADCLRYVQEHEDAFNS